MSTQVLQVRTGSATLPYVAGLATKPFGLTAVLGTAVILAVMLASMHESVARRAPSHS